MRRALKMIEYTLTKSELQTIRSYAHDLFTENGTKFNQGYDGFLTECFVEAIKWFCASKGLVIKNGKIYKVPSETE